MTEQTQGLTPEDQKLLKRPFTAEAVQFRVQGKISGNKTVRVVTYIDARLVQERLDEVDPNWTMNYNFFARKEDDPLGRDQNFPVACNLTVKGVTRPDVGQNDDNGVNDNHVKAAVSDAFKRAAVPFGIGRYLYSLGETKLKAGEYWVQTNGKVGGINEKGFKRLRKEYNEFISQKAFVEKWGEAIDYGLNSTPEVVEVEEPQTEQVEQENVAVESSSTGAATSPTSSEDLDKIPVMDEYEKAVAELAKLTGHSEKAAIQWMAAKKTKTTKTKALQRAVKKAQDNEADQDAIDKILSDNNLLEKVK